jgi:hypothetical protein
VRMVTHLDVTDDGVETALEAWATIAASALSASSGDAKEA